MIGVILKRDMPSVHLIPSARVDFHMLDLTFFGWLLVRPRRLPGTRFEQFQ